MPQPIVLSGREEPRYEHGSIYFVGTATVILRYAGFTILTDPNFLHQGDHVHLGYGLRATRRTNPAIDFSQLPEIDLVLLSHLHEDHFDKLVQRELDRSIPILTTPKAARALARKGFRAAIGIDTWDWQTFSKSSARLHITSMPGRHGPPVLSRVLPPVMGSLIEFEGPTGATAIRLYISGDTLVYDQLREIPKRYPDIDLALMHLGGTRVLGILVTMDGKQGVEAIRLINPRLTLPIHYDDYTAFKSPLDEFAREVTAAGLQDRVHYLHRGETYVFDIRRERLDQGRGESVERESEQPSAHPPH